MENNNLNPLDKDNLQKESGQIDFNNNDNRYNVRNLGFLDNHLSNEYNQTQRDQKENIEILKDNDYDRLDMWRDSKKVNRVIPALAQYRNENSIKADDDFQISASMLKQNNVPFQYWEEFNDAGSKEQFDLILENLNVEIEIENRRSRQGGFTSFAYDMGASITDPVQIAVGIATGGLSAFAKGGSVATKLGTAYAVGTVEGVVTGAMIDQGLHTYTASDVVIGAILGGAINTGFAGAGIGVRRAMGVDEVDRVNNARQQSRNRLNRGNYEFEDLDIDGPVDTTVIMSEYAQAHDSYSKRTAIEDQFFNNEAMLQVEDIWEKQNLAAMKEVEGLDTKISRLVEDLEELHATGDKDGIESVSASILRLRTELNEKTLIVDKQSDDLNNYKNLEPIDQAQYLSDTRDALFGDLGLDNPSLKAKLDMDEMVNEIEIRENQILDDINAEISDIEFGARHKDPFAEELFELEELKLDRADQISRVKAIRSESGIQEIVPTNGKNLVSSNSSQDLVLGNSNSKTESTSTTTANNSEPRAIDTNPELVEHKDGGAAATDFSKVDYNETYIEKNSDSRITLDTKEADDFVQALADGGGINVNQLPKGLKWLNTIQSRLNLQGGKSAQLGRLLYNGIATQKNTVELQLKYYKDEFKNPVISKQVAQYRKELNAVSGREVSESEAISIIGKELHRGNLEGVSDAQLDIAHKFNSATQMIYDKYNARGTVSVEIEKAFIQQQYGNRFQSLYSKPIDGGISLEMAFKNHFKTNPTRSLFGSSEARKEMGAMLQMYSMNKDHFDKTYPNLPKELESTISKASDGYLNIYKEIQKRMSDLDIGGNALNNYAGPVNWKTNAMDQADAEYGNEQIIGHFQGAIESSDPKTKRALGTEADDFKEVKADGTKAETDQRPVSLILATAIVNNTMRRKMHPEMANRELGEAFHLAMTDFKQFVKDNPEVKKSMGKEEYEILMNHLDANKEAGTAKSGLDKHAKKRIEIDYFFESKLKNQKGGIDTVSISQFMEMDAERNIQGYLNTASSHISFAEKGIKSQEDLNKFLTDVKLEQELISSAGKKSTATKEELDAYNNRLSVNEMKFQVESANALFNGTSMIDFNNPWNRALQLIGKFNFMRMMGRMGIAQTSEFSELAHQGGITTLFKHIPEMLNIQKTLKNSKGEEFEHFGETIEFFGWTTDPYNAGFHGEVEDGGNSLNFDKESNPFTNDDLTVDRVKTRAVDLINRGSRSAGWVGQKVDKFLKQTAVKVAFSELDRIARVFEKDGDEAWLYKSTNSLNNRGININTLSEYGLNLEDLSTIKKAFDDYALFNVSESSGNRIIRGLNLTKMEVENPSAYKLLNKFAIKAQNEVVAPSTIGNSYIPFVNSQVVKMFGQFRNYPMQSVDGKLRHKLRKDNSASSFLLLGAMTGFISYSLNVLASAGKYENPDDFLEDKFSFGKILAGSYSRSVYAWFMPAILGSAEEAAFGTDYFSNTRTTGLSQSITGNPTFDLVDNVFNLGKNAISYGATGDDRYLTKMYKNSVNVVPWAVVPFLGEAGKVIAKRGVKYKKK